MHGSGGNNFQMILFDLISSIFKCWFRFEFSASNMLFVISRSKFLSKDLVILLISYYDGSLTFISVDSDRRAVFGLGVTSSYSVCFEYWCYCSVTSINSSSVCLNFGQIYQTWPEFFYQGNI